MTLTWQEFRNRIKNKKFIYEGNSFNGWDLPMHEQKRLYIIESNKHANTANYINTGAKKYV